MVLLSGGKVPCILRPVNSDEAATDETSTDTTKEKPKPQVFTFVGDAYIHGIMQEECRDEEKLRKLRLVQERCSGHTWTSMDERTTSLRSVWTLHQESMLQLHSQVS